MSRSGVRVPPLAPHWAFLLFLGLTNFLRNGAVPQYLVVFSRLLRLFILSHLNLSRNVEKKGIHKLFCTVHAYLTLCVWHKFRFLYEVLG